MKKKNKVSNGILVKDDGKTYMQCGDAEVEINHILIKVKDDKINFPYMC